MFSRLLKSPLFPRVLQAVCGALLIAQQPLHAWTPGTGSPTAVQGFVVDPMNRTEVLSFYNTIYTASENYAANLAWTGNVAAAIPGTTGAAFKDDVRRRINFYRALAMLPADITFDATKSSKDQEAALMFSANNAISHTPPNSWFAFTANAAQAAGASNIALGTFGPGSVDAYMRDDGPSNQVVGHRRWLQYTRAAVMGTGDVPNSGSNNRANAIWVIGDFKPSATAQFVAWPNRGYVPVPLVPARWSLSYPGGDFAAATVDMTVAGVSVSAPVVSRTDDGFGDNTIVWQPSGVPTTLTSDVVCNVTVSGISGAGVPTSYNYSVTLFDPNVLGLSSTISGNAVPPTTGTAYSFTSIPPADAYELRVSTGSTAPWTEGAEDSPLPQIAPQISAGYTLRQTAVTRTGARAFQLVTPEFWDQSFELTREFIPQVTSQLQFYDLARFTTPTVTLSAEVSANDGGTWTTVFSRPGVGLDSALWDAAFNSRAVSLSAFAGQLVRVRFILRWNGGSLTTGTTSNHGFFIDDITVTNATELVNTTVTPLAGAATSFTLNPSTAGAPLTAATRYYLRIRPNVGTRWFGDGPIKSVVAQVPTAFDLWAAANYPAVTGGAVADHDFDGTLNGFEYAFGLNPTVANPPTAIPQPVRVGDTLTVTFIQPAGVTGVTYGAQWSRNLVNWTNIPESGIGGTHTFTVSTVGEGKIFFRHRIVIGP